MTGDEQTPGADIEQPLGSWADVIGGVPTAADWEAGYRDLHKHLQTMHQALLAIWHMAEPGDTEYMTFREPDDVLASVRTILAERSATIERTAVLASDLQALLTHERVGRSVDDRVSEIISALGSQSTDADVANRGQRMTFADAFAAHEYDEEQDRLAADQPLASEVYVVPCGCDGHGDHLGCDARCAAFGCSHPLDVLITRRGD